jgi:hypothetical protein
MIINRKIPVFEASGQMLGCFKTESFFSGDSAQFSMYRFRSLSLQGHELARKFEPDSVICSQEICFDENR